MKKIYSLVLVIGFLFTQMIGVSAKQISTPYTTEGECTQVRAKNEIAYGGLQRSDCFKESGYYKYYLCSLSEDCGLESENPYSNKIAYKYKNALDKKLSELRNVGIDDLKKIKEKIATLATKYKDSELAINILGYFLHGVEAIIDSKTNNGESDEVKKLICTLTGKCDDTIGDSGENGNSGDDSTDSSWSIKDPYQVGANKTAGPYNHPNNKDKVYIVDRGNSTYVPTYINGINSITSDLNWNKGSKTNEIWSIRLKSSSQYTISSISPRKNPHLGSGTKLYTYARYDYTLSTKPGLMTTDFKEINGGCHLTDVYGGSNLTIVSASFYEENKEKATAGTKYCVIPEGIKLYFNIQTKSSECNDAQNNCNNYVGVGDGLRGIGLGNEGGDSTPQPTTPAPIGGTQACVLADGVTKAHGGNNGIYSLYSKNGCGLIGGLACDNGRITSAGFSPNIDDTPKDWYNTKSACDSSTSNLILETEVSGDTVKITHKGTPGGEFDWIGIYKKGETDLKKYLKWKWVKNTSGTLVFDQLTKGEYEAKLFYNRTYNLEKESAFTITTQNTSQLMLTTEASGNSVTVAYDGTPGGEFDWIGIYEKGETDLKKYLKWKWVKNTSGTLVFDQLTKGEYEAKLFYNRTYVLEKSISFTIEEEDNNTDNNENAISTDEMYIKSEIKRLFNEQKEHFIGYAEGSKTASKELYTLQIETQNVLDYAEAENDVKLLDDIFGIYLLAAQGLHETDKYRFYNIPLSENKYDILDIGEKQKMWLSSHTSSEVGIETLLNSAQFLSAISQGVNIIASIPTGERTKIMNDYIQEYVPVISSHYTRWSLGVNISGHGNVAPFDGKGWRCKINGQDSETSLNHSEYMRLKSRNMQLPEYCDGLRDLDLFIFNGIAHYLAAHKKDRILVPIGNSEKSDLRAHLDTGLQIVKNRMSYSQVKDFNGNTVTAANFDVGHWHTHPDYAYSAHISTDAIPSYKSPKTSISWDLSHSRRRITTFGGLNRNQELLGLSFPKDNDVKMLANQFAYVIFNKDLNNPMFSNYTDGSNGWYRIGYAGRNDYGYAPGDLSITFFTGGWSQFASYNPDIGKISKSLLNMMNTDTGVTYLNQHFGYAYWSNNVHKKAYDFKKISGRLMQKIALDFYSAYSVGERSK